MGNQQTVQRLMTTSLVMLLAILGTSVRAGAQDFVSDGVAGFVVSHFEYALSGDAADTGACPNGMSEYYRDPRDVFLMDTGLQQQEGELLENFARRVQRAAYADPEMKNLCLHPELGSPDPKFRSVTGKQVSVYGIDLDGVHSENMAAAGTCPHNDLHGMNGETGIDNQFFRVVGCINGYQPTGQANVFAIEMLAGSWGILIQLSGVDDIRNDDQVEVGIYANGDPIQLSASREPLEFATYSVHKNPEFHAKTRGRIVDGVLTTEPVEVRIPYIVDAMYLSRVLRDAQLQVTLSEDGALEGYLAGYAPLDKQYSVTAAPRGAELRPGELAPVQRRTKVAIGKAVAFGNTCEGFYYALQEHADGHPDPKTGHCTSISTQYRIQAVPAFVIEADE